MGGPQTILIGAKGTLEAQYLVQSVALNLSFPSGADEVVGLFTAKGPIRLVRVWHFQLLKFTLGPVMQWEGAASMTTDELGHLSRSPTFLTHSLSSDIKLSPSLG